MVVGAEDLLASRSLQRWNFDATIFQKLPGAKNIIKMVDISKNMKVEGLNF